MARTEKLRTTLGEEVDHEVKPLNSAEGRAEAICPTCGVLVETHRCRLCGAVKTINPVSKNLIWMRNGRLVAGFHDEKQAYVRMAMQHGIPKEDWPERFKEK